MALPSLVQSATASSAASGPASITPTLGVASIAKNFLAIGVVVVGTSAPSITTPANWLVVFNVVANNVAVALFYFPSNPGGITSVAVTVSAPSGGASAIIAEFQNMPAIATASALDASNSNLNAGSTTANVNIGSAPPQIGELVLAIGGFPVNVASVGTLTPDFTNNIAVPASTNGTANSQGFFYYGTSLQGISSIARATLASSLAWYFVIARFFGSGSFPDIVYTGGVQGTVWPQGYSGSYSGG